jgi:hypothetical protein
LQQIKPIFIDLYAFEKLGEPFSGIPLRTSVLVYQSLLLRI